MASEFPYVPLGPLLIIKYVFSSLNLRQRFQTLPIEPPSRLSSFLAPPTPGFNPLSYRVILRYLSHPLVIFFFHLRDLVFVSNSYVFFSLGFLLLFSILSSFSKIWHYPPDLLPHAHRPAICRWIIFPV